LSAIFSGGMGYSQQANGKTKEGTKHIEHDAQFH
jgi:hypothetical protein